MARNLEAVRTALARRLPGGAAITAVTPLSAGYSNETYVIEGPGHILRLPPAGEALLPHSHDVLEQASIYEALAALMAGPPAPRVLDVCADRTIVGDPFFVMERMPGEAVQENAPQTWFTDGGAALREGMCRQWITSVAGLARLPTLGVLGPPRSPEAEAGLWRELAVKAEYPQLVAAFDRLLQTPAPRSGPPTLVHGDTKLANLLWREGMLTAVLDWEMSYNGEPLADLGYLLYFFDSEHHAGSPALNLSGMYRRDQFIAAWSDISGRPADGVVWHEIAALGKLAAILGYGYHLSVIGKSDDFRFPYFKARADYDLAAMEAKLETDDTFAQGQR